MPLDRELDIAQAKRREVFGGDEAKKVMTPSQSVEDKDNLISKTARSGAYKKTMDAGRTLQNKYREQHGLDEYNRPVKKVSSRSSSRR